MNLTDQVVSLEWAKKLREAGVEQESYFSWHYTDAPLKNGERWEVKRLSESEYELENTLDIFSAYSVAELGEIMKGKGMGVTAYSSLGKGEWWVRGGEWIVEKQQYSHLVNNAHWPDALAEMLYFLLTNGLVDVKQLKVSK